MPLLLFSAAHIFHCLHNVCACCITDWLHVCVSVG